MQAEVELSVSGTRTTASGGICSLLGQQSCSSLSAQCLPEDCLTYLENCGLSFWGPSFASVMSAPNDSQSKELRATSWSAQRLFS